MASVKKIALGLATVLAISSFAVSPASATVGAALTVDGNSVTSSAVAPVELNVPDNNVVNLENTLKIAIADLAVDTTVTAAATNAKVLTNLVDKTASSGSNSASVNTGSGSTATFYVYTTSVKNGSIVITVGGDTSTYYVKGLAGSLNRISLTSTDSAGSGTVQRVTASGVDVFGNPVVGATISLLTISGTVSNSYGLYTDVDGTDYVDIVLPASGNVTLVATASVADAVTGLPAPIGAVTKSIGVRDLVAELAAKDLIIADLQAQLKDVKIKYNGVAKRLNSKVRKAHRVPFLPVQ